MCKVGRVRDPKRACLIPAGFRWIGTGAGNGGSAPPGWRPAGAQTDRHLGCRRRSPRGTCSGAWQWTLGNPCPEDVKGWMSLSMRSLKRDMAVWVGSTNPTKVGAAETVFARLGVHRVAGLQVSSDVSVQPLGVEETRRGAVMRALHAQELGRARGVMGTDTAVGVGLEGGVERAPDGSGWLIGVACIVIDGQVLVGYGPRLLLPPVAVAAVEAGEELGPVIDRLSGLTEAKAGIGAIGWLTSGLVSREASWVVALGAAAAPLFHPDLYAAGPAGAG